MSDFLNISAFVLIIVFLIASMFLQTSTENNAHPIEKPLNKNINKVADGLYITNFINATDYKALKALGVRQILIVGTELPRHGEPLFKVMTVRIDDHPDVNIKKHFNSTYNFINHGPTLVHCAAGISRSATIVAAFLMRKYNLTADKAVSHIKKCRSIVQPNNGFMNQLHQFEKDLQKADGAGQDDSSSDSSSDESSENST